MSSNQLYHWTHRNNLGLIAVQGLRCDRAEGQRMRIWAASAELLPWALVHVSERHQWKPDDVCCVAIDTDGYHWNKGSMPGIFFCLVDVPPTKLGQVLGPAQRKRDHIKDWIGAATPFAATPPGKPNTPTRKPPAKPPAKPAPSATGKPARKGR